MDRTSSTCEQVNLLTFVQHGNLTIGVYYRSELQCYWRPLGAGPHLAEILRTLHDQLGI